MFKKMSVGTKLILSFLILSSITLIVGWISFGGANKLKESLLEVSTNRLPSVYGLELIHDASSIIQRVERNALLDLNKEEYDLQLKRLKDAWSRADKGWKIYEPLPRTSEEDVLWKQFIPAWRDWKNEHGKVIDLIAQEFKADVKVEAERYRNEARSISFGSGDDKLASSEDLLLKLIDLNEKIGEEQALYGESLATRIGTMSLLAPIIGVLLSLFLGIVISGYIRRNMNDVVGAVEEIAKGNLDVKIEWKSEDEIGRFADSFNQMVKGLQEYRDRLLSYSKELEISKARLDEAQHIAHIGNWDCDMLKNELIWSDEIYRIFGLVPQQLGIAYEEFINSVYPEDRELVIKSVNNALNENKPYDIDYRIVLPDGSEKVVHEQARVLCDEAGRPVRLAGTIQDVTERKRSEVKLAEQARELLRSNEELEKFAYVASHDLQEPLRTISSFTQLLARRYKGRLDTDADEFISFIVDGAARMQRLINDLLAYSRVDRGKDFVLTDCESVLSHVLDNLREAADESSANITHDLLPTITSDPTQMEQLFQNLIGNAIKFRRDEPPKVHISATKGKNEWHFSVRDNGIGITPDYFDRIFIMFQRLHGKNEYSGTGVGLAICKKIVERHGGRIWVESEKGKGSTFYFTIPVRGGK